MISVNPATHLECGAGAEPLLSVADFDGDGKVRGGTVAALPDYTPSWCYALSMEGGNAKGLLGEIFAI